MQNRSNRKSVNLYTSKAFDSPPISPQQLHEVYVLSDLQMQSRTMKFPLKSVDHTLLERDAATVVVGGNNANAIMEAASTAITTQAGSASVAAAINVNRTAIAA